jgi:hypothetical protein
MHKVSTYLLEVVKKSKSCKNKNIIFSLKTPKRKKQKKKKKKTKKNPKKKKKKARKKPKKCRARPPKSGKFSAGTVLPTPRATRGRAFRAFLWAFQGLPGAI